MSYPAPHHLSRRDLIKTAAVGAVTVARWPSALRAADTSKAPRADTVAAREHGLRLGVATYSTRMMSLDATIEALKALRIVNAGVFKNHCNWETASLDECRAAAEKFKAAGIAITGSGVINLSNDEAKCRKAFENVRAGGMATMVVKPDPDALPLVEKLAKEYDQKVAIHNHGPEDKVWPSPYGVLSAVEKLDARIGLCLDVGHTMRAKVDPIEAIRKCAPRLYDMHLKDSLAVPGADKDIPVEVGAGRMDIRGMLRTLHAIKYSGVVAFEYEKPTGNPVIGLAESVGYVRGLLASMAG
jgi:inosose dehydratase